MNHGKRKGLTKTAWGDMAEKAELAKTSISAKGAYPFRVVNRQFSYLKTRYWGPKKNTAGLHAVCAGPPLLGEAPLVSALECGAPMKRRIAGYRPKSGQMEQEIAHILSNA